MQTFQSRNFGSILTAVAISLLLGLIAPIAALAATAPTMGTMSTYGIISSTFTNSNTAPQTIVNGDRCDTTPPASAPITTTGTITTGGCDAALGTTQTSALSDLNGQSCTSIGAAVDLNAITIAGYPAGTFPPGCYSSTGAMNIVTGTTVTLSGAGVYIFRPAGTLTTGANSLVVLANGASASDVFWTPVGATTLGANAALSLTPTFVGNIFRGTAAGLSITLGHFANLLGRTLAFGSTVTTDANTITVPTTLRVIKAVVNTGGGTKVPSDFTLNVKLAGVDVSGSPAVGTSTPGLSYSLAAGTYVVSEVADASYTSVISGNCNAGGSVTLAVGDNKTCTITNTYIVDGGGGGGGGGGSFAPVPLINVTKIPSPLALPLGPGLVTYTYALTNIGPVAAANIWVKDDKCSSIERISSDINDNARLDINEVWIYRCTKIVSQTETNTATAHGNANGWDAYDTAKATVVVGASVTPPLIHLVKRPNVFVLPVGGGAVTYMYTVTNPGTAPLSDVTITDDKCTGLPGRVVGHPGDLNKNNLLESNEAWNFTCQTNLTYTTTNVGTATGHANGFTAIDYSTATVVVAAPTLPNTGFPSDGKNIQWGIAILSGIFAVSFFLLRLRKIQTV